MAKRKDETTNEKIVRLYKEGHSFDDISRIMEIPKGNIVGIVEKYFPEYQTYEQPKLDHSAGEEKEKGQKGRIPGVGFFKRGGKSEKEEHKEAAPTINLDMDEAGFLDKTARSIAQLLKTKTVNEVAEFFGRDKADINAVKDLMEEHFRRVNAEKNKDKPASEEPESEFATGLESTPKVVKRKYNPPTYTKRDDPKPVSAAYGLIEEEKKTEVPVETAETAAAEVTGPEVQQDTYEEESEPEIFTGLTPEMEAKLEEEAAKSKDMFAPKSNEPHTVSLLPDENKEEKAKEEHKVSLIDSMGSDDGEPEIPSIEPVSEEVLEKELTRNTETFTEDIPGISLVEELKKEMELKGTEKAESAEENKADAAGVAESTDSGDNAGDSKSDDADITNVTESVLTDSFKEASAGMTAMEKMRQFAQEQIALNNKKIEELKSKKTDAENNAFDCNTKVEAMKKEIEEMQAKLITLIAAKDDAGKIVADINDEIEAINKENADYNSYL